MIGLALFARARPGRGTAGRSGQGALVGDCFTARDYIGVCAHRAETGTVEHLGVFARTPSAGVEQPRGTGETARVGEHPSLCFDQSVCREGLGLPELLDGEVVGGEALGESPQRLSQYPVRPTLIQSLLSPNTYR